jgi:hypothetical protein
VRTATVREAVRIARRTSAEVPADPAGLTRLGGLRVANADAELPADVRDVLARLPARHRAIPGPARAFQPQRVEESQGVLGQGVHVVAAPGEPGPAEAAQVGAEQPVAVRQQGGDLVLAAVGPSACRSAAEHRDWTPEGAGAEPATSAMNDDAEQQPSAQANTRRKGTEVQRADGEFSLLMTVGEDRAAHPWSSARPRWLHRTDHAQVIRRFGCSRIAATSASTFEPSSPSTRRWSKLSASVVT